MYAPSLRTSYGARTLPGVREAVEAGRWDEASEQVEVLTSVPKALNARVEEAAWLARGLGE